MAPKRAMQSKTGTTGRAGWPLAVPALAISVACVAAIDGGFVHPVPRRVLRTWASTATTLLSRPWRIGTSVLLTSGPKMTAGTIGVLLVVGLATETRVGWRAASLAGAAGTVVATVACDLALLGAAALGSSAAWTAAREPDYGISAVTAGMAGALAATLPARAAVVVAVVMLNGLVVHHQLADWEHLVAFAVGFGVILRRPAWARS